jgi:hypothetical protein
MKMFLLMALLVGQFASAAEQTCGLVEASVWDGNLNVNIADLQSFADKQQNFKVLNPMAFSWQAGGCVCVEGLTSYDPDYENDYLYMQITVTKKVSEDLSGESCARIRAQ